MVTILAGSICDDNYFDKNGNTTGGTCEPILTSCKAILLNHTNASSGYYRIDPDGIGVGASAFNVYCDMTTSGGGWTVIADDTFTNSVNGWSATGATATTSSCGTHNLLGGYGSFGNGATVSKNFPIIVSHVEARVCIDFMKIDSWDNETASISLDNTLVASQTFATDGSALCGRAEAGWNEYLATMVGTLSHSTSNISVSVRTTLNSPPNDESWGLKRIWLWVR